MNRILFTALTACSVLGTVFAEDTLLDLSPAESQDILKTLSGGKLLERAGKTAGKPVDVKDFMQGKVQASWAERPIFLALDVFETEPLPEDSPLRNRENVLITPHRANNSIEFEERWQCLAKDLVAIANGDTPDSVLTEERAKSMSGS